MNTNACRTILLALCLSLNASAAPADTVVVASPAKANPAQRLAVEELASCLGRIYPQTRFVTAGKLPASGNAILVGSDAPVRSMIAEANLSQPESFAVRSVRRGNQQLAVIAGTDTRGANHRRIQNRLWPDDSGRDDFLFPTEFKFLGVVGGYAARCLSLATI